MASKKPTKAQIENVEQLKRRLTKHLMGIFGFIFISIISISFFGPQIGALFGFISKNKNQVLPQAPTTLPAPSFVSLPKAVNKESITIEGFSSSGSNVKVYVNGPEKGEVLAGGDGKFVIDNIELIEGRNTIFAKAIDEKGNESEKSDNQYITLDKKAPRVSILQPLNGETIKNLNKRILIKGEINEKSKIHINGKLAVQQPDNSFEYLLGVSEGDVEIKVEAEDDAGNKKEEKIFIKYEKD